MKKIIGFLGASFLVVGGLVYLFFFYVPGIKEPEGLSLEVKTEQEVQNDLGFIPIVSPGQTVFLPEVQNIDSLEGQLQQEAAAIVEQIDQQAEAAKKTQKLRYGAAPIPDGFEGIAPKVIEINLSRQTIIRWENGQKVDESRVSSGKRSMPTPQGLFYVKNKINLAYSRKYRLYMPYWMAFNSYGYGMHELPVFRNGKREGANHLGRPVSHGCVRLGIGPAATLYSWAQVGTPVVIH